MEHMMTPKQKITRELIEAYLTCRTKAFLMLTIDSGAQSDYDAWCQELGSRQKLAAAANLARQVGGGKIDSNVKVDAEHLDAELDVILFGHIERGPISFLIDGVVRSESTSRKKKGVYIPALFHDGRTRPKQNILLGISGVLL